MFPLLSRSSPSRTKFAGKLSKRTVSQPAETRTLSKALFSDSFLSSELFYGLKFLKVFLRLSKQLRAGEIVFFYGFQVAQ